MEQEKNNVKWFVYRDDQGRAINNSMEFDGRVLQGRWCGPRWVFRALSEMSQEERARYRTHNQIMGAINRRLAQYKNL